VNVFLVYLLSNNVHKKQYIQMWFYISEKSKLNYGKIQEVSNLPHLLEEQGFHSYRIPQFHADFPPQEPNDSYYLD
jgi:hypothetical protein